MTATRLGRTLIIGGGRMGEAILAGLLNIEGMTPDAVVVAEPEQVRREHLIGVYRISCVENAAEAGPAQTVFLAVKPQVLTEVVQAACSAGVFDSAALVVSIAAGRTCASIESLLPAGTHLVRVMPNMPLMVGKGTAAVAAGSLATPQDVELVCDVFNAAGTGVEVLESELDIATALSGSGPAYFARFVDAMATAGEKLGMDYESAYALSLDTMLGTAAMLSEGDMDARELIVAVSSPGGTTVAALDAFTGAGLDEAIDAGVEAAFRRSKELSN